jgi:hypothetical protein
VQALLVLLVLSLHAAMLCTVLLQQPHTAAPLRAVRRLQPHQPHRPRTCPL